MSNIYLTVPYAEKDEVKVRGGKWDPQRKSWFAPKDSELELFVQWLPLGQWMIGPICLQESMTACWKCGEETVVFALSCDRFIEVVDEDDEKYVDDFSDVQISVSDLVEVDPAIERFIKQHAPRYHMDYSQTQRSNVWMNHCDQCGAKQGDFYLHSEPGGAFFPISEEEQAKISHKEIVSVGQFMVFGTTNIKG